MKRFIITLLITSVLLLAQGMNNYCSAPPFVGGKNAVVIPNVLITHDMTGSMRFWAYHWWGEAYNPMVTYYGYADPNSNYGRVSIGWRRYFQKKPVGSGTYSGNMINYAFMTRMDVSRKAFTGGKGRDYDDKSRLLFERPARFNSMFGNYTYYGIVTTDSTELSAGIIREIADKDYDFAWDEGAPYFALQTFSTSSRFYRKVKCPFGSSLIDILTVLENQDGNNRPTSGTNCGDAIFEAIHYLRFCNDHWNGDYSWNQSMVGTPVDPWYEVVGGDTVSVSCRPTFCLVVGDGGSNSDHPVANCTHLPHPASPYGASYWNFYQYDGDDDPYDPCSMWPHDRCGDDYAYYAHVTDLRPDADPVYGIPDEQTITFYSVYLFAQGDDADADSMFFRKVAKHGGFIDINGNKLYDLQVEYDADADGRPDNFFYVNRGEELEDALTQIFININALSRMTSATAGAITGTTQGLKSGGLTFLSQFYPRMELPAPQEAIGWIGKTQSLWLGPYGWIREETQGNDRLHLKNDYVIDMFFSVGENRAVAARFQDTLGRGNDSSFVAIDTVAVSDLRFVWDAADELLSTHYNNRDIYTNLNGLKDFTTANDSIDQHLDYGSASQCDSLIDYVRGRNYSVPNYRSREFGSDVWKLGDIIHSSPMPVGRPPEAYHIIYGDGSYYDFWNQYLDRRNVVYVGANDGMLHAFNSGLCRGLDLEYEVAQIDPLGITLGKELWAYIPYNVLPHLKWLTDTSYCHVYYVDLRSYPTDAKVFTPDADHPHGWGTMLVSGMRLGGGEITVPGVDTYRSSYSCFDITNPESGNYPQLLWEFTDDELGFTMCVPTIVKIADEWFLVYGSGPTSIHGTSDQRAKIYIANPFTGAVIRKIEIPDDNTAITNIFAADWGLDYSVDLIYFGTYDNFDGGKIYRINTHQNTNPVGWTLHQVIDLGKPVTAEGSVATDGRGNLWIYFGTGKYFTTIDVADTTEQVFVGIKDDTTKGNSTTPAFIYANLLDVTNVHVFSDTVTGMGGVNNFEDLVAEVEAKDGWYQRFNIEGGERVITPPLVFAGAVVFTTFTPADTSGAFQGPDLCIGGGGGPQAGNLWALFYLTGTAYKHAILDTTATGERETHVALIGDMPSEPAWFLDRVFVASGGAFGGTEFNPPYNPFGGVKLWRGR